MSLKNRGLAEKTFEELSNSISETDKIMIETRLLMYRFLSEIERITDSRGITRKELAKLAGTSASYITQLFQGKKIINLQMLTRIKKALNIDFKIEVVSTERKTKSEGDELASINVKAITRKTVMNKSVHGERPMVGLIQNKIAKAESHPGKSI